MSCKFDNITSARECTNRGSIFIALLLGIFCLSGLAAGQSNEDYYIDPILGDDSNSGLNSTDISGSDGPWESMDNVPILTQTGDNIHIVGQNSLDPNIFEAELALWPSDRNYFSEGIQHYSITWSFNNEKLIGRFINGDYWVVKDPNFSIIEISPEVLIIDRRPDPNDPNDPNELLQLINGSMFNPSSDNAQGYDEGVPVYDAELTVNVDPNIGFVPPSEGSLISSISWHAPGSHTDLICHNVQFAHHKLKHAAVLTILDEKPPPDAFRPGYFGSSKTIYRKSDLDYSVLAGYIPSATTEPFYNFDDVSAGDCGREPQTYPTVGDQFNRYLARPWLLHVAGWQGRQVHPTENMPNYHERLYNVLSEASVLLQCDLNTITGNSDELDKILLPFLQIGIDSYSIISTGESADSGLHPMPIYLLGRMLGIPSMYQDEYSYRSTFMTYYVNENQPIWLSDNQSSLSSIIVPPGQIHNSLQSPDGKTIAFRQSVNTQEYEHISYYQTSHPDHVSHLTNLDCSDPNICDEWGQISVSGGGCNRDIYRSINSPGFVGIALSLMMLGDDLNYHHPPLLDYVYRWMIQESRSSKSDFINPIYYDWIGYDPETADMASNPNVIHTQSQVNPNNLSLSWQFPYQANIDTYDVYLDTVSPPINQLITDAIYNDANNVIIECGFTFNLIDCFVGNLQPGTPYYWRVDTKNTNGTQTGQEWLFFTTPESSLDDMPPIPNPMNFSVNPQATNINTVIMTAQNSIDMQNMPTEYYFEELTGNAGGNSSGWQIGRTYTDSDLEANTLYFYQVKARDSLGNTTAPSEPQYILTPKDPKLEVGVIENVTDQWQTVPLYKNYRRMVVVATPNYSNHSPPVVTRVRNAFGNQFELRVQSAGGEDPNNVDVHFMVMEEGVYSEEENGFKCQVFSLNSSGTDNQSSWIGDPLNQLTSFDDPVVLGQVMTSNDPRYSYFWSRGSDQTLPPSNTELYAGKSVGEDPQDDRQSEQIGYIILEAGSGTIDDVEYITNVGSQTIQGMGDNPPYSYSISGLSDATVSIASQAGMNDNNGGWVVLFGEDPYTTSSLKLAIDEDQFKDSERQHNSEQVAYIVFDDTDFLPPNPDPASWQQVPTALDGSTITMSTTTATDRSYPVEYSFKALEGAYGDIGTNSGWQTDPAYTDTFLIPGTTYGYQVRSRDTAGNTTDFSVIGTTTTDPMPEEDYIMVFSKSKWRSDPIRILEGNTVDGIIYPFVYPADDIETAYLWTDDPNMTPGNEQIEIKPPFDLAGGVTNFAFPFDTDLLTLGEHTVTVRLEFIQPDPNNFDPNIVDYIFTTNYFTE